MTLSNLSLANVVKVDGGYGHSLAITSAGELYAWGLNADYQLGDGTTENRLAPTKIGTDTDWVDIACGENHSIALKSDGSVYSWGRNTSFQCGKIGVVKSPQKMSAERNGVEEVFVAVDAEADYCVFCTANGQLWFTGNLPSSPTPSLTTAPNPSVFPQTIQKSGGTSVRTSLPFSAGPTLFAYVETDRISVVGTYDFDSNIYGSGGSFYNPSPTQSFSGQPGQVYNTHWSVPGTQGLNFTSIGIGRDFLLAVADDFKLYGYTFKQFYTTGLSTPTNPPSSYTAIGAYGIKYAEYQGNWQPVSNEMVVIDDSRKWLRVSCGLDHALLTDVDNNIFSVGNNDFGQLGRTFTGSDFNIAQLESPANTGSWPVIGCGAYHSLLCLE